MWPVPTDGVYQFQGITADGACLVSAQFALKRPPVDSDKVTVSDPNLFRKHWLIFEKELDLQLASSFTPDLALLDEMIGSLSVTLID